MDAAVTELTGGSERMDTDGARAARGRVDTAALELLLDDDYYRLPAPKSTGKELFHGPYLTARLGADGPTGDDLLATLTELTARLVADAVTAHALDELVVAGGGIRNPTLMARVTALCAPARIRPLEEFGIPAQAKEAYLFALLGYLAVHGLEGTIPSATGARRGSILGSITPGASPIALPEPAVTPRLADADRPVNAPPRIRLRPGRPQDGPAMATVMVAAWRGGYRGVVPDEVIDGLDTGGWTDALAAPTAPGVTTAVAVTDTGAVVGFARFGPDPDDDAPSAGHLASLYVDPSAAGAGVGRRLVECALAGLAADGRHEVSLWVFRDNARARALYERCGFVCDGVELTDARWRTPQVRYRRHPGPDALRAHDCDYFTSSETLS